VCVPTFEERRWWKLLRVPNNNQLPSPRNCAKGVFWLKLGRLIHDHEIENQPARFEVLRD
jgi:hypothetical protein